MVTAMKRRPVFAVERVTGANHRQSGKPCQDEAGACVIGDVVAAAVADGHGTSVHADAGARMAVCEALATLIRFAQAMQLEAADVRAIQRYAQDPFRARLVRAWKDRVRASAGSADAPLADYGATLLTAVAAPDYLLVGQLGDGDVLLVDPDGSVEAPLPDDPASFGDETASLCLPGAEYAMRVRALPAPEAGALLLLATDGYGNSYESDADFRRIGPDYLDLIRRDGIDAVAARLPRYLDGVTTRGSGDDVALAMLYWPTVASSAVAKRGGGVRDANWLQTVSELAAAFTRRLWKRARSPDPSVRKSGETTVTEPDVKKAPGGDAIRVEKLLGYGGQGRVWRAFDEGQPVAVKIYHPHMAVREQRQALERLVGKGPPAPQFLWPLAMVEDARSGAYGYLMPLREPRFRAFEAFMARRIKPSMRALVTAGAQLAKAFLNLHAKGLCYCDISFANIFLDPETGDVCICDNDNVDITGAEASGVLGTPQFMAPEVVRQEVRPSADTDRHSLAVLLFYLLYGGHPLDGRREKAIHCFDLPARELLYGAKPLYIWDPDDESNRPVPGIHDNPIVFKAIWPKRLKDLFLASFTDGLHYPAKRVRESVWRDAFLEAMDSLWLCRCGAENFRNSADAAGQNCWKCKQRLVLPPRIKIGDSVVLLNRATRLFGRHLGLPGDAADEACAEVAPHPTRSDVFGLRNLTKETWMLTEPNDSKAEVSPGKTAPIMNGARIDFGRKTGEIRA